MLKRSLSIITLFFISISLFSQTASELISLESAVTGALQPRTLQGLQRRSLFEESCRRLVPRWDGVFRLLHSSTGEEARVLWCLRGFFRWVLELRIGKSRGMGTQRPRCGCTNGGQVTTVIAWASWGTVRGQRNLAREFSNPRGRLAQLENFYKLDCIN